MKTVAKNKGQTLIESLLAIQLLLITIAILLRILQYTAVYFVSQYVAERTLICMTTKSSQYCNQYFKKTIRPLSKFARIEKLYLGSSSAFFNLELKIKLLPEVFYNLDLGSIRIKKELHSNLPTNL